MTFQFDPKIAFSRSLGWVTPEEQIKLSEIRIGIAGLGGVGGQYAETLTRLGICKFVISDPDTFSQENTNRQNGCQTSNYGRSKAQVIQERILDINPTAQVEILDGGIDEKNVESFCKRIDYYVDGLDLFAMETRALVFRTLRKLQKTGFTIGPIGSGSACIVFTPGSMSFDDYFGLHRFHGLKQKTVAFLVGLSPSLMQRAYLVDQRATDFDKNKAPSLPMGILSCASLAATLLLKFVRGVPVRECPCSTQYDPYLEKLKRSRIWLGHRSPLYRLKIWLVLRSENQKGHVP